ncbi:MAG: H(+)/Cl(-) exchange transporter ClcA [Candidatus Riflebacteria bacterium]|nr:H(+)/Cl(-) exchange transporter ClcA [Candidatus Riflebacteria bacterium]
MKEEVPLLKRQRTRRRYHFLGAVVVGALSGWVAVGFQIALKTAEQWRETLIATLSGPGGWGLWAIPVLAAGIISLVAWVTRAACPAAAGSGIPHLKGVLLGVRVMDGLRLLAVKFVGGVLAIGAGLSLGREGPTVQMGGAIGQQVGLRMGREGDSGAILIAVGAGAGLSAAFNAPLAGFLFVMEELHFEFAPLPYISALAASITADTLSRAVSGQLPVFLVFRHSTPPLPMLPWFAGIGVVAGLLAILFKTSLLKGLRLSEQRGPTGQVALPIAAGVIGALAAIWFPEIAGSGHRMAEDLLNSNIPSSDGFRLVLAMLAGKFALTVLSYLAKVPGGIFAPMLAIGGAMGYGLGLLQGWLFPGWGLSPAVSAVVGMASFFSGVVHAPLTGIALILEMTSNFNLLFPMMLATVVAFSISESFGGQPVYEALLNEDLAKHGPPPLLFQEPVHLHLLVEERSELVGKPLSQLGMPEGVLFVSVNRRGHKFVPGGGTILVPGDALEIMISGEVGPWTTEILDMAKATEEAGNSS